MIELGFKFGISFMCAVGLIKFAGLLITVLFVPRDATDPPAGRSGMALSTDHETGVQYLRAPGGGITPRLNPDGSVYVTSVDERGR